MADSPSSSSSSPERERKKKVRLDDALGLHHHAAVGAISKPNQEEADLDVDADDSCLADDDSPDLEKGRSPESVTERDDLDSGADEEEEAEPDADEEEEAKSEIWNPNQEADSVAPDDCNLDIRKWWLAYEKTLAANADEEESDPEEAVADADEEESDPEEAVADADEEESDPEEAVADADEEESDPEEAVADADEEESDPEEAVADADEEEAVAAEAKNPSEEKAEPVEEKGRREYIPEEFTPLLDKYMEQLALHHGFEVDLGAMPVWLKQKLVHPINFNHPFHKPIVDGICRGVCAFANKIQKQELEFVRVMRANREGQIEYRYYITFEARDRLDTCDGENGTIKTYQSRAFVRIRALEKSQRLSLRIRVESLDTVPPTPKPALC